MSKKILLPGLFLISLVATIMAFVLNNEFFSAPMLMTTEIFFALWLFQPKANSTLESHAAFWAIISFGAISVLLSFALSLLVPIFGSELGFEAHPDDQNGILYPAINDGRENCFLGSIVFLLFFFIAGIQRFFTPRKVVA